MLHLLFTISCPAKTDDTFSGDPHSRCYSRHTRGTVLVLDGQHTFFACRCNHHTMLAHNEVYSTPVNSYLVNQLSVDGCQRRACSALPSATAILMCGDEGVPVYSTGLPSCLCTSCSLFDRYLTTPYALMEALPDIPPDTQPDGSALCAAPRMWWPGGGSSWRCTSGRATECC
jgi:hypothetical protein